MKHDYAAALKEFKYMDQNKMRFEHLDNDSKAAILHALRLAEALQKGPSPSVLLEMMKIMDGKGIHDTFNAMIEQLEKEISDD